MKDFFKFFKKPDTQAPLQITGSDFQGGVTLFILAAQGGMRTLLCQKSPIWGGLTKWQLPLKLY